MSTVATSLRGRDPADTKTRLLEAAERLFAERGYSGTSMRAVTQAAGVSVSAANYHFGSKDALLAATIGRVLVPVNEARLARLEQLERDAADGALDLRAVLDCFLRPAIESRGAGLRQVAARLFSDPPEVVRALKKEHFGEILDRFVPAVCRALPGREPEEVALRFQFLVGVMVHVISGQLETSPFALDGKMADDDELVEAMVRYAEAGFAS